MSAAAQAGDAVPLPAPDERILEHLGHLELLTDEQIAEAIDAGFIANVLAGRFTSHADAERIKENALAFKHLLAARRAAGALVEIDTAEAVLFEVFRATRDAWLNWPTKVAPHVAAELGLEADRMTEVLTLYVHQQLAELGEPEANFAGADPPG